VCLLWIGFADGMAPNIISAAYNKRSLSVLNWFFKSHRSLPLEHYLDHRSVFAAAVAIAIALHLATVLFIGRIDRRHRRPDTTRACSRINFILIAFSAVFFAVTVLSWTQGDYHFFYLDEWRVVLAGRDSAASRAVLSMLPVLSTAAAPLFHGHQLQFSQYFAEFFSWQV
jgi:hypothetical protein